MCREKTDQKVKMVDILINVALSLNGWERG